MTVVPPAVVISAASGPAVMMSSPAMMHVPVAMPVSLDLNYRIVLHGRWRDPESCGSRCGDSKSGRGRRDGNEHQAFHEFLQIAGLRLIDTSSRAEDCSTHEILWIFMRRHGIHCRFFPSKTTSSRETNCESQTCRSRRRFAGRVVPGGLSPGARLVWAPLPVQRQRRATAPFVQPWP
jgi:hypothetical protein